MSCSDLTAGSDNLRLDSTQITVTRDPFNKLHLSVGSMKYADVRPVRGFPLSEPRRYILLFDSEDQEIGLIEDLADIDPDSRQILTEEIDVTHLITSIRAIQAVQSRHGVTTWQLDTTRGFRLAHLKDRSDIRRLPGRRVILTDVHGMRFEVADADKLDLRSQALLEAES